MQKVGWKVFVNNSNNYAGRNFMIILSDYLTITKIKTFLMCNFSVGCVLIFITK